ncbi:MAG: hypothetical protein RLW87_00595 [Alphaproteobacteria bacterium]|jgi:hypothetical protein|uniref:hypothetical protein n=1 Tax=Pacificispira sp. TaxID=2888761 RepID=UPI001B2B91FE|nr:hypothetical protein [Alphaproteobacteria bacterium]MBO6861408.1 hypothetical protein [Alphaproteobacteria bacterium]MEC9268685.1 hypothetical protein [Pseudomonadota bacterium]
MDMRRAGAAALLIGSMIVAGPVLAGEPSAMVEDISSSRDDVQMMDYLEPGQTITLAPGEILTLGYFLSCAQETITGGTVTIGDMQSDVSGGTVETAYVSCDDQVVTLSANQQQEAGTTVMRPGNPCDSLVPDVVVYDVSPLVRLTEPAASVEYVDACSAGTGQWTKIGASEGLADFRAAGIALVPGQTYLIRRGDRTLTVLVSKLAEAQAVALIARLVPL